MAVVWKKTENIIKSIVRNDQEGWKGKKMACLCDDEIQGELRNEAIENLYSIPLAILLAPSMAIILPAIANQ